MRNIQKLTQEFETRLLRGDFGRRSTFDSKDIQEIYNMSPDSFHAINNALNVGFMVGYKAAQRANKKTA